MYLSVSSIDIHLWATSQEMPQTPIIKISLGITQTSLKSTRGQWVKCILLICLKCVWNLRHVNNHHLLMVSVIRSQTNNNYRCLFLSEWHTRRERRLKWETATREITKALFIGTNQKNKRHATRECVDSPLYMIQSEHIVSFSILIT